MASELFHDRTAGIGTWTDYFNNLKKTDLYLDYHFVKIFFNRIPFALIPSSELLDQMEEWSYNWDGTDLEQSFLYLFRHKYWKIQQHYKQRGKKWTIECIRDKKSINNFYKKEELKIRLDKINFYSLFLKIFLVVGILLNIIISFMR